MSIVFHVLYWVLWVPGDDVLWFYFIKVSCVFVQYVSTDGFLEFKLDIVYHLAG